MAKHGGFGGGMPGMNMNNLMKQYHKDAGGFITLFGLPELVRALQEKKA